MGKKQRGQRGQGHGKNKNASKGISKAKGDFNENRNGRSGHQNGRNNGRDFDRSQSRGSDRKDFNKAQRGGRNNENEFGRSQSRSRGNNRKEFNKSESRGKNNQRGFDRPESKGKNREMSEEKNTLVRNEKNQRKNNGKKSTVGGEYAHMVGQSLFKIIPEGEYEANQNENEENHEEEYEEVEMDENELPEYSQEGEQEDEGEEGEDDEGEDDEGEEDEDDDENEDEDEFNDGDDEEGEEGEEEFEYEEEGEDEEENLEEGEGEGEEEIEEEEEENGEQMDEEEESDQNVDISVIGLKIQETIQVLMNVGRLGQGKPRKHFINKLKAYVHRYYGYNFELIDHFLNFFNPAEMVQFFEANETHRPLTIRTNTLKIRRKELAQFLIQRGVNLDPLAEWSKVGIKIYDTKVPIGATPEYLAGYYMLQSGSSFLPVLALDPQMNEKILDMASAPGGKTSYIAQIMKNTGSVFANDLKKDRLKALQFNMYRLGISNTVVTCRDGRKYPEIFPNTFDRVLLDAPCTGLGIISKDHSIKANRVLLDIYKNSHVQKQLLLAAIDCTKVGGVIVYSTCSVSPLENEEVINYALKKRFVKIVDIDDLVEVGDAGLTKFIDKRYHLDLRKTKRIYPHVHNMDGFYLGKLVKLSNGKRESVQKEEEEEQNDLEE